MRTNKKHTYSLFIFSDLIVVGKRQSGPGHHKPYLLKGYIPMKDAKVTDIFDSDLFEVRRGYAPADDGKEGSRVPVFQFVATDAEQKKTIITQLKNLIKDSIKENLKRQSSGMIARSTSSASIKASQPTPQPTPQPAVSPATPTGSSSSLSVSVPSRGNATSSSGTAIPTNPNATPLSPVSQSPKVLTPGRVAPPRPGGPARPSPSEGGGSRPPMRSVPAAPGGGEQSHVKTPRRAAPPPPCKKP